MIELNHVSVTYPGAAEPVLNDVTMSIPESEFVLVVGKTGSGKSTLLSTLNGLVPHFTGGTLAGEVIIDGRSTATHHPRDLADLVGIVPQDPLSSFVTDTVEDELAYGMECLGIDQATMRKRVEETLDQLGLAELRTRSLHSLSGGQRQRVAIGAVLTSHPKVLVLDEPTSALDPAAAEEVLAALQRLVHDVGITVIVAEHRLERVVQYADHIIVVPGQGAPIVHGTPAEVMLSAPIAPPVVQLGRMLEWSPLPLSVRDARRAAGGLRELLVGLTPPLRVVPDASEPVASARAVSARYSDTEVLHNVNVDIAPGDVVALMGRNGAGKSTLLATLVGLRGTSSGEVRVRGTDPARVTSTELVRLVGYVPQEPGDLLTAMSVADECRDADRDAGVEPGTTRAILALLAPEVHDGTHPRDLSEGQRLLLTLAIVLAARPPLLLLDEPTRGLDYPTKARLTTVIADLAHAGHGVVLATHDVELAAELATRVIVLADGEVVADGEVTSVLTASPMFAPQVAKVLSPLQWLTVGEVAQTLTNRERGAS